MNGIDAIIGIVALPGICVCNFLAIRSLEKRVEELEQEK